MQQVSPEMPVETGLRILLVEDSPTDAELIVHRLEQSGLVFCHRRVETADLLLRELAEFDPDIVLCDNRLPSLDATSVIEIALGVRSQLPIIIVTGTLEDEAAVELIKAGAVDFVRKDRLGRLPVAVTSALENTRIHRIRREQEARLRDSELMLRLALKATSQGVWRWEVGQGVDDFKWDAPCSALLGLIDGEPTNYAVWTSAVHASDRAAALADMKVALDPMNGVDDYVSCFRSARADGPEIWLAAEGRAVFESDPTEPAGRRPVCILGTIRDVSRAKSIEREREETRLELVRAREAAEQASRAKSLFLAGMSHELRTPLQGILGYAELLAMEGALDATQLQRLCAIRTAGKHLLAMIDDVLDVVKIEADRLELFPVEIELTNLVRDCLAVVRPVAEAKRLGLALTPAAPLRIFADPARLRQVLINLLGNALRCTPAGAIEVRLRQVEPKGWVRLEVADIGPGIPEGYRENLFKAFERLDADAIEGVGLGLALSARLVHVMQGRIGYADNSGGGSVFWLELPPSASAGALPTASPTATPLEAQPTPVRSPHERLSTMAS